MTKAQMLEIELHRQIHNFQEAVTAFAVNKSIENANKVAKAKGELCKFMVGAKV